MGVKCLRYQRNKFGHVGKPMIGQHGFWQLTGNKSGPVVRLIANTSNARINDSIYIDKAAYEAAFGAHAKVAESPITDGAEYPFFNNPYEITVDFSPDDKAVCIVYRSEEITLESARMLLVLSQPIGGPQNGNKQDRNNLSPWAPVRGCRKVWSARISKNLPNPYRGSSNSLGTLRY